MKEKRCSLGPFCLALFIAYEPAFAAQQDGFVRAATWDRRQPATLILTRRLPHSTNGRVQFARVICERRARQCLSRTDCKTAKSAFLVADLEITHYIKLHTILTDHSPLKTL